MKSLNFGASVAPRITQAASHSHVSRVEMSNSSCSGVGNSIFVWGGSGVVWLLDKGHCPVVFKEIVVNLMMSNEG